jgi:hypothetical protein
MNPDVTFSETREPCHCWSPKRSGTENRRDTQENTQRSHVWVLCFPRLLQGAATPGGCGLRRCEWVGGLSLSEKQGPSDRSDCVQSYPVNVPHCDYRLASPRQPLFGSSCKYRHVCTGRSSGGGRTAAIKPLELIRDNSLHNSTSAIPNRHYIKRALRVSVPCI